MTPEQRPIRATLRALLAAARLACPHCGTRWRRTRFLHLAPRCASCGLALDRGESDYFLGSYTLNLLWSLVAALGLAVVAAAFPIPPALVYGAGIPMIAALAIWLYPTSRLVWLAADLQFRPATPRDFEPAPEQARPPYS